MRFRAPLVAAMLLGGAVTFVWLHRDEPASAVPEGASSSAVDVPLPALGDGQRAVEAAVPGFPPAPQERAAEAAASVVPELSRSPLPGEAPTTPLVQLFEDQRALRQPTLAEFGQESPRVLPQIAESERAFAAEPIDASWAAGAEADMLGKVAQINGLKLLDLRVECRSTLCRFEMAQPGSQDTTFQDVLGAIGLEAHWAISLVGRTGSLNTVAYLWREGFAPARPNHEETPDEN